jgi:hypothetical protein
VLGYHKHLNNLFLHHHQHPNNPLYLILYVVNQHLNKKLTFNAVKYHTDVV